MLIDTEALVKTAGAIKAQAAEVRALLENHRTRLRTALSHAEKQHKAQVEAMETDHRAFVEEIDDMQKALEDALARIAGQEPKEVINVAQEG